MIKFGKTTLRSYMTMNYKFTGVCLDDGVLYPNTWDISVDMVAGVKHTATQQEVHQAGQDAAMAYEKIKYWLDINLNNVLVANVCDGADFALAMHVENPVMYMPGSITDDTIVQLLHAKMTSLANGKLTIGAIRSTSQQSELGYTFDPTDTGYSLPSTVDYFKHSALHHDTPWWFRNDGFCMEIPKNKDNPGVCMVEDPLDEFERETATPVEPVKTSPGRVVHIDSWVPKKV